LSPRTSSNSLKSKSEHSEPWLTTERLARILFDAMAPDVLKAMSAKPQRTRTIAEAAKIDRRDALWVLKALTTGFVLVGRRGDWWRLTENGLKAMAGEPAPKEVPS
jgi:hypothetical protein